MLSISSGSNKSTLIDVDTLVNEVRLRPPLWNYQLKEYRNKNLKSKLWIEVNKEILPNWRNLNAQEQEHAGTDVQKKWRNLRDTFVKALAAQKKAALGRKLCKRRPYIHFKVLSFLAHDQTDRDTSRNISKEESEDEGESESDSNVFTKENKGTRKRKRNIKEAVEDEQEEDEEEDEEVEEYLNVKDDDEDETVEAQPDQEIYDEDICFSRMLVPMFKKLNDDQKHFAKVKILQVMNRAKYYCSPDPLKQLF